MNRLPEAWIAPPELRELRELVRYRAELVTLRSGLKAQVHATIAEVGDVTRFRSPRHLASWSGLTPRHHESDTTVRRGHITKQGSRLVRWAAMETAARQRGRRSD